MIPTLPDLRKRVARHWESGAYHRDMLSGCPWSPLVFRFSSPSGKEAIAGFRGLQANLEALRQGDGVCYRLLWDSVDFRKLGTQKLPVAAEFETEEAFLSFIGKAEEGRSFRALALETRDRLPGLLPFLAKRPGLGIQHASDWSRLLDVVDWFLRNPRSGLFLRQIDLPGIDTKFIEGRRAILAGLLNETLPADHIIEAVSGLSQHGFEKRFGLAFEEPQIRFRILDAALGLGGMNDLAVPASQFAACRLPVKRVFLTENKVNGLVFPPVADSIVIFGLGYGLESLSEAVWLQDLDLHYWGDLDSHGFAMLSRLRTLFPKVNSFLMDPETLAGNLEFCTQEPVPASLDQWNLTQAEFVTLGMLERGNQPPLRLEQERIPYHEILRALAALQAEA